MITKNYIKMCERNKDLQKGWKPKEYDIFTYDGTSLFRHPLVERTKEWMIKHKPTWLPTQEQLWEKVEELLFGEKCELNIIYRGTECIISAWQILEGMSCIDEAEDTYTNTYEIKGKNIKECLLKLIMKINWNKTWTGKKWVVANE